MRQFYRWLSGTALCAALLFGGAQAAPLVVDGALFAQETVLLGQTNYVPLRAVCERLLPDAQISWADGCALVQARGLTLTAKPGERYLLANGRPLWIADGVAVRDGSLLVPARVLGKALGAQVGWQAETGTVSLSAAGAPLQSAEECYDADDLYWLARIISAESKGEPLEGQIAVGNVVLNRVSGADFPESVYDVVFDARWGGQFEPVDNGSIYSDPTPMSVLAAKLCLEGANTVGDSLYFFNPVKAQSNWIAASRTFLCTIGAHSFYR